MARLTYSFGDGRSEGNAGMKALLGARGAHKCEMANLGLPVAPGFCITQKGLQPTGGNGGAAFSDEARNAIKLALSDLENTSERQFGNLIDPLLLSVQSDEKVPPIKGFTGVVANIGLNDNTVQGWERHESPHFVWDSYRRLISTFSRAVKRLDMEPFERELSDIKSRLNAQCQLGGNVADCHIPTHELRGLVERYKEIYEEQTGESFPQEPETQLSEAISAASRGWDSSADQCVAPVTVQTTIYGNRNFRSAVGVTFTKSETGDSDDELFEPMVHGQWLMNAQIEDLDGDRTRQHVTQDASRQWAEEKGITESERKEEFPSLEETMPSIFAQLLRCQDTVDNHFSDIEGLSFAVDEGKLWLLQTSIIGEQQADFKRPQVASDSGELDTSVPNTPVGAHDAEPDLEPWPELELDVAEQPTELGTMVEESVDVASDQVEISAQASAESFIDYVEVQEQGEEQIVPMIGGEEHVREAVEVQQTPPRTSGMRRSHHLNLASSVFRRLGLLPRRAARRTAPKCPRAVVPAVVDEPVTAPVTALGRVPAGLLVLPLWQTALAGGAGAVCCRAMGSSIAYASSLKAALQMGHGTSASRALMPSVSMQQGLRAFVGPAGPARAFPTGAVCCTVYTNLSSSSRVDDSPLLRLACAATAVRIANAATQGVGLSGFGSLRNRNLCFGPALSKMVPTLAIEMCAMDLVRNAAVSRGQDVGPGLLIASGAAAGTVAQSIVHPLNTLYHRVEARSFSAAMRTVAKEGASSLFAGIGPACCRSMPIAAMNSLVRVGMVTQFTNIAGNAS